MAVGIDGALSRALDFQRGSDALAADRVTAIPEGWLLRSAALPLVWSLNYIEVAAAVEPAEAVALADRHLGDLPYRHLYVTDPAGERLATELGRQGWRVERNVLMALVRGPDQEMDTGPVIEADESDALGLMWEWTGEEPELRDSPEGHHQLMEACRLVWHARNAQRLGVVGPDGALAGITMVFSDGVVSQVEDVYVVPGQRGRGLGRLLVTHAVRLARDAGHELAFIVADDQGWPKHLYAKAGFEPVGRTWTLHR